MPLVLTLIFALAVTTSVRAESFTDDFTRPDGPVGNGWGSWNGTTLAGGQVKTFGSDGFGGGIFRSLPTTFPVTFSFDFRTESPLPGCSAGHPGGAWVVAFNAPGAGYAGGNYRFFQYHGAGPIYREVLTTGGVVEDQVASGVPNYGAAFAHISGAINTDLSATITINGVAHAFGPPAGPLAAAPGSNFVLANTNCAGGPYYFDNVSVSSGDCEAAPIPAFDWKQYAPWGSNSYDNSYFVADVTGGVQRYATANSTVVLQGSTMEVQTAGGSYVFAVPPNLNNAQGVAYLLQAVPGINAVVGGGPGSYFLNVYNTSCRTQSCFPRPSNVLMVCDGRCGSAPNILNTKTMGAYACAVTALAMAMSSANVTAVNEASGPFALDPLELNEFMSNTLFDTPGGLFDAQGNLAWERTTNAVALNIRKPSLQFDRSRTLDDALCKDKTPVIVQVTGTHGTHYVLVTAKRGSATDGSQYSIADPGSNKDTLLDYNNQYTKVGVVKDPIDVSQLVLRVGSYADFIVIDSSGRRTGFDAATGQILEEIPLSGYIRDSIADDINGSTQTPVTRSVQIQKPTSETYRVLVTGAQAGSYALEVEDYPADGSLPTSESISALTAPNATREYTILRDGDSLTPLLGARDKFQAVLLDIDNSVRLGLIDDNGVANSLKTKIRAAARTEVQQARNGVLEAATKELNAQTGKHIFGVAASILAQDLELLLRNEY